MTYKSIREKVNDFIKTDIIEMIKQKDLDYNKIINFISTETGARIEVIEDVIKRFIDGGIIGEIRSLTVPYDRNEKMDEKVEKVFNEIDLQKEKVSPIPIQKKK